MPKGFTEKEKELIIEKLHKEGTRLFAQYGVRKTTVDEIAGASGISKGSFYSFFDSKEELFFDILDRMDKISKKKMDEGFPVKGKTYKESMKKFLSGIFEFIEETALLKKINPSELEQILRKLPEERIAGHLSNDNKYLTAFYEHWAKKDVFRKNNPIAFAGLVKILFYFNLHKNEFDAEEFDATRELLINMISEFLVKE